MKEISEIEKELTGLKIERLDKITVLISNDNCLFSYTRADDVCKPEFLGKYRFFGGLQCNYHEGTEEYNYIENKLCNIAEQELNLYPSKMKRMQGVELEAVRLSSLKLFLNKRRGNGL